MGGVFHFQEYPVYKDTREFRKIIKKIIKEKFPKEEKYCLSSQLSRALDSILLNIAEGSERYSKIDFGRFLNNALTSLNEVVSCLDAAFDDGYLLESELIDLTKAADNIYRQLKAFCAKVRSS